MAFWSSDIHAAILILGRGLENINLILIHSCRYSDLRQRTGTRHFYPQPFIQILWSNAEDRKVIFDPHIFMQVLWYKAKDWKVTFWSSKLHKDTLIQGWWWLQNDILILSHSCRYYIPRQRTGNWHFDPQIFMQILWCKPEDCKVTFRFLDILSDTLILDIGLDSDILFLNHSCSYSDLM